MTWFARISLLLFAAVLGSAATSMWIAPNPQCTVMVGDLGGGVLSYKCPTVNCGAIPCEDETIMIDGQPWTTCTCSGQHMAECKGFFSGITGLMCDDNSCPELESCQTQSPTATWRPACGCEAGYPGS